MDNTIGIRRENLSKKGEKRVGIIPSLAQELVNTGVKVIVQPAKNPVSGEIKRAFRDDAYQNAGAEISEDLSSADIIFGLKEVDLDDILTNKPYFMFSHTHKGQVKNRQLLQTLVDRKNTVIDYELITDDAKARIITAFTYFAGYAGMIDTFWALGKRLKMEGVSNPFERVPQSIETEDLTLIKNILAEIGEEIKTKGTPAELPPMITLVLGNGKTSAGAQEIFDILPHKEISIQDLPEIYASGDRKVMYKLVLDIHEMYRLKQEATEARAVYDGWPTPEKHEMYFRNPEYFESNLDQVLPYCMVLMNCILWGPQYPRTLPNSLMKEFWQAKCPLRIIGDITCDPNGSIEFSKETWIDDPVFVYNPDTDTFHQGFDGQGVAVMAVTNLPCEFSADASAQFSENLQPLMANIVSSNWKGTFQDSGLDREIKDACILWKGEFTKDYSYMKSYLQ